MPQPRYRILAQSLRADILSGLYPVGSQLPSEQQLCESFSVSRHTVREALRCLDEDGMIRRRQGAGTEVVATDGQGGYRQSLQSLDDLLQYASSTQLNLDAPEDVAADGALAALLGVPAGQRWRRFRGLRIESDQPLALCTTDVYLHPEFADIRLRSGAVYRQLEQRYGLQIAGIEQDIAAVALEPRIAMALSVETGAPGLRIVRRYAFQGHGVLEVAVSHHPADRFTYTSRLTAV